MDIRHTNVITNGIRLHVAETGAPDAPLMVFLHGFPEFWYAWKRQLADFAPTHLCVAPDQRGYNLSEKPWDVAAYRAKHLIRDVLGLADHYGREKFTLVAHDWGGAIAWAFAMMHADRLDKLVMINSAHPATFQRDLAINADQIEASQYIRMFKTPEAEATLMANDLAGLWGRFEPLMAAGKFTDADKAAYFANWREPGSLTGGLNWYRASPFEYPVAGDVKAEAPELDRQKYSVNVPTLIIWGEQDTALLPSLIDGIEEYVPDVTIRRVPHGSHWVVHEEPEQVTAWIREFLEG